MVVKQIYKYNTSITPIIKSSLESSSKLLVILVILICL
nr:MAG TPA: hypothetical protein [Caudoviricetes sp.]